MDKDKNEELERKLEMFDIHTLRGLADNLGKDNSFADKKGQSAKFLSYLCGNGDFDEVVSAEQVDESLRGVSSIIERRDVGLVQDSLKKHDEEVSERKDLDEFTVSDDPLIEKFTESSGLNIDSIFMKDDNLYEIVSRNKETELAHEGMGDKESSLINYATKDYSLAYGKVAQKVKEYEIVKNEDKKNQKSGLKGKYHFGKQIINFIVKEQNERGLILQEIDGEQNIVLGSGLTIIFGVKLFDELLLSFGENGGIGIESINQKPVVQKKISHLADMILSENPDTEKAKNVLDILKLKNGNIEIFLKLVGMI